LWSEKHVIDKLQSDQPTPVFFARAETQSASNVYCCWQMGNCRVSQDCLVSDILALHVCVNQSWKLMTMQRWKLRRV